MKRKRSRHSDSSSHEPQANPRRTQPKLLAGTDLDRVSGGIIAEDDWETPLV